jgi:hypothetical protein
MLPNVCATQGLNPDAKLMYQRQGANSPQSPGSEPRMHLTPFWAGILLALAAALMIWNAKKIRAYQQDYRFEGGFTGKHYDCMLGSANSEATLRCRVGADPSHLYLMARPEDPPRPQIFSWRNQFYFRADYPTDLAIPWNDLECRPGRLFFKEVIWFRNDEKRFYVYVPREIGESLLTDAGRALPL